MFEDQGQHISIRKQLRENIRAQYQKTQWYENILEKFHNWKLKCSLLFKRKTKKQNEQKQTNLEKQKTKQNLLTLFTPRLFLHHIFFSIFISASATP